MMERISSRDGVAFYRSTLLVAAGAPHAFSTRIGGVSPEPFGSLNLGNPSGRSVQDTPENIRENYRRLLDAAGFGGQVLTRVSQVHGARVVEAESAQKSSVEADAIVTSDVHCAASVRVADCVPVLLASRDGRRVAAVHAGWRGVVAGVVMRAVERLCAGGFSPAEIVAAVGPCIGFDAFEIGAEVVEQFTRVWGERTPVRPSHGITMFPQKREVPEYRDHGLESRAVKDSQPDTLAGEIPGRLAGSGKYLLDLRRIIEMQLLAGGVLAEGIDISDRCTHRDAEEFYSHRRDRGLTGRMAAVIAPGSD